jgi:hypothetical protein
MKRKEALVNMAVVGTGSEVGFPLLSGAATGMASARWLHSKAAILQMYAQVIFRTDWNEGAGMNGERVDDDVRRKVSIYSTNPCFETVLQDIETRYRPTVSLPY